MYGHHDSIQDTVQTIQNRFVSDDYAPELKEWANDQLTAIQEDLDLVVRGREGYTDFLLTYIGRERERFALEDAQGTPYESARDEPLCTCDDLGCELKRGNVPLRVREADSIGRGIQLFKQEHNGDPLVLDHDGEPPGARQRWSEKRADVWHVLRRVQTYFTKEREAPPTADELADDSTGQPETAAVD